MSDFDMIKALRQNDARLRQTEVKETPGGISGFTSFYDSGTFTPSYQGTGTAGTWAYAVQAGFWHRIGAVLFFRLSVNVSSRSVAPTGAARIIGLPFTSIATANTHSPIAIDTVDGFTLSATCVQLVGRVPTSASYIELIEVVGTAPTVGSFLGATGFGTASFIRVSGHYLVA